MLVTETRSSGLMVARDGMDEASVGRALRRATGGRFVLQKRRRHETDPADVTEVYKVVHVDTGRVAFTWMDDWGNPLPLSSGLIDGFLSRLDGSRNKPLSEDEWNARLVAERERDSERENESLADDWRPYIERDRSQVAFTRTGKPRYWRTERARPKSAKAA